jgi:hypothetical protein
LIKGFDQAHAIVMRRNKSAGGLENSGEIGTAEIGHTQDAQTARGVVAHGVHRHDVGVLKAGKYLRFVTIGPGYLNGHKPPAQVEFFREVDTRKCSTPKLCNDTKTRQLVSRLRQSRAQEFLARRASALPRITRGPYVRRRTLERRP